MDQQQQDPRRSKKDSFHALFLICLAHSTALSVPLRTGYGREALGVPGIAAFALIFLWAMFSQDPLMWLYFAFYFLCHVCQRITTAKLLRQGERIHSHYSGWPRVAMLLLWGRVKQKETIAKGLIEPCLCFMAAIAIGCFCEAYHWPWHGLFAFLLLGMLTMPFVEGVNQQIWDNRLQAMRDARMEQEYLTRRLREEENN
jgi:hypothetical protein